MKNPNLKVLCLTPKSRKSQVATASFLNEPSEFKMCMPDSQQELLIEIAGEEIELAIDVDFYGIV